MRFTTELLKEGIYPYDYIGNQTESTRGFLYVIFMHKNGIINREKMIAMFRSLREGTLLRYVNTYHCNINDKWYNGESMIDVLEDVFKGAKPIQHEQIDFDEMLSYLNLYLNKPKNYCIDYIYSRFVNPLIQSFGGYARQLDTIQSFGINCRVHSIIAFENFSPSGYCCDDCDGDYMDYKRSQYERECIDGTKDKLKKAFTEFLIGKRKVYKFHNPESEILTTR